MVFQSYALYPHMTVYENIGFPLRMMKLPKAEIDRRVRDAARSLELEPTTSTASRVALRRAAPAGGDGPRDRAQAPAFLMDEPLSNLDAKLRVQMRAEIARLQKQPGVDHGLRHPRPDRGDDHGRPRRGAEGRGTCSRSTCRRRSTTGPANVFVAAFIGSPSMNLYQARLTGDQLEARLADPAACPPSLFERRTGAPRTPPTAR